MFRVAFGDRRKYLNSHIVNRRRQSFFLGVVCESKCTGARRLSDPIKIRLWTTCDPHADDYLKTPSRNAHRCLSHVLVCRVRGCHTRAHFNCFPCTRTDQTNGTHRERATCECVCVCHITMAVWWQCHCTYAATRTRRYERARSRTMASNFGEQPPKWAIHF